MGVDAFANGHTADFVVVARFAIEQVYAETRGIDADVVFLSGTFLLFQEHVFDIDGIAKEYPSPAEVWSHLNQRRGCKGDALSVGGLQAIEFVGGDALQHHREIVALRFYVVGVYLVQMMVKFALQLLQVSQAAIVHPHPFHRIACLALTVKAERGTKACQGQQECQGEGEQAA